MLLEEKIKQFIKKDCIEGICRESFAEEDFIESLHTSEEEEQKEEVYSIFLEESEGAVSIIQKSTIPKEAKEEVCDLEKIDRSVFDNLSDSGIECRFSFNAGSDFEGLKIERKSVSFLDNGKPHICCYNLTLQYKKYTDLNNAMEKVAKLIYGRNVHWCNVYGSKMNQITRPGPGYSVLYCASVEIFCSTLDIC